MTFEKFHLPHRTISGLRPTAETPRPAHGYIYNGRARILCRFQYHPLITTGKFLHMHHMKTGVLQSILVKMYPMGMILGCHCTLFNCQLVVQEV